MPTREELEAFAKQIWEEAFGVDPIFTMEVTVAVTGGEVFVWGNLRVRQLQALGRALLPTARMTA